MIVLPIKRKWFDMILSGEKKEEYRENKPYYTTRFQNERMKANGEPLLAKFVNGYSHNAPTFIAEYHLEMKTGNADWGAVPDVIYYALVIDKITDVFNV